MWWKTSSGRHPKTQNGLSYSDKSKRCSCHGLASWNSAKKILSLYVRSQSFTLQGELPTKAEEPPLPMGSLPVFPSPRWAAPLGQSKPDYTAPGTRICPLLLAGIQGVPHGGRSRTQHLHHSMDVLGKVWGSPIPAFSDYVDPI